jgi:hypothetical protein
MQEINRPAHQWLALKKDCPRRKYYLINWLVN